MANYDITTSPEGVRYIAAADLPAGVTADSSFTLASLSGNATLLKGILDGSIALPGVTAEIYVDGGSFSASTMDLTLTDNDAGSPNVVISLGHSVLDHSDADSVVAPTAGQVLGFSAGKWRPTSLPVPFAKEWKFGRINSSQNVRGPSPAGTVIDLSAMTGVTGKNAGAFGATGYTALTPGTYKVRCQIGYDTANLRYSPILRVSINGTLQPAQGLMGYTRDNTKDNLGGCVVEDVIVVTAGQVIGFHVLQDSGNSSAVNLVANASTVYIEKLEV